VSRMVHHVLAAAIRGLYRTQVLRKDVVLRRHGRGRGMVLSRTRAVPMGEVFVLVLEGWYDGQCRTGGLLKDVVVESRFLGQPRS